jgi:hypothetical protein
VTNPKQGKKRLTLIWLKREIQIAAMHKKLDNKTIFHKTAKK